MRGSLCPASSSCDDRADQVPGRRIDAARKRPAAAEPIAARRRGGRGRAERSAPSRSDCPATRPRSRPAPASATCRAASDARRDWPAPRRSSRQPRPITETSSTIERNGNSLPPTRRRLQDAEQPAAVQILDRLVGQPAQLLGLRRRARAEPAPAPRRAPAARRNPAAAARRSWRSCSPRPSQHLFPRRRHPQPRGGSLYSRRARGDLSATRRPVIIELRRRAAEGASGPGRATMIYMVEMDFPHPERDGRNGTPGIWRISGCC